MRAFFYEWLVEQRNASIHTVRSYRDTWRLPLRFAAQRAGKKAAMITMTDLAASEVSALLSYAEHERGGKIGTRNCRLAAIRSFFTSWRPGIPRIDLARNPQHPCQARRYRSPAIWIRRKWRQSLPSLTVRRLKACAIMRCSRSSTTARRSEYRKRSTCAPEAIRFESPSCVRLTGKGRKERICPLWPETALLLKKLLERQPRAPDQRLFVNRYGEPLSASGVRFSLPPT